MSLELIDDSSYEAAIRTSGFVIIQFGATWCCPCKLISPILHELSDKRSDVKFCKVDIDESPISSSKMNIRAVPTIIIYKDGAEVKREVGSMSKNRLEQLISDCSNN